MTGMPLLGQDLLPQRQRDAHLHQAQMQQPMANSKSEWNVDLCHCSRNPAFCCRGFWCCCCNACTFSEAFGQARCLPLCDTCPCTLYVCSCGLMPCISPAALSLRVAMRDKYGIKGTLLNDIVVSAFCLCCSWCQMINELKYRQGLPPVVDMQPQREAQPSAPVKRATGFVVASY